MKKKRVKESTPREPVPGLRGGEEKQSEKLTWLWETQRAGWDAGLGGISVRKTVLGKGPWKEAGCSWQ